MLEAFAVPFDALHKKVPFKDIKEEGKEGNDSLILGLLMSDI